jgi:uncharacterized protein
LKRTGKIDWIALVLVIIGGLNWGLVGIFGFNAVEFLFSESLAANVVYTLVGISAVYTIIYVMKN